MHLQPDGSPIVSTTILGRTIRVCGCAPKRLQQHLIEAAQREAMSIMGAWLSWLRHGCVHVSGKQGRTYR